MIILDTNVVSELLRQRPNERVMAWLDTQPRTSVWITSVTILEIEFGLEILARGKQRSALTEAFEAVLTHDIGGRVAPFDRAAAQKAAVLMASRSKAGRPVELRDTMIAGIALASRASLATRNVSHFADLSISVLNPWDV